MKRLLLHICCGGCSCHVVEKLSSAYEVSGFFFNPNIHPWREHDFRWHELERASAFYRLPLIAGPYDMAEWFQAVKGLEREPEKGKRCGRCFHFRLAKTFEYARIHGFDAVATTLSVSPHKDANQINEQGLKLAEVFAIPFLAENFKKENGFRRGRKTADSLGIKPQNYCGCCFSKAERMLKSRSKG